jgi:copper(I)-binding protein
MLRLIPLAAALLLALPAFSHELVAGDLTIIHPHIPQPAASAMAAGGFMVITNDGSEADYLIGVETDIAAKSELHESRVDANGMGSMTPVEAIEIAPGATINLEHGGYHIMFMGLKAPLVEGQTVKGALIFEHAGRVEIEFMIDPPGEGGHDHGQMPEDGAAAGHAHGDHAAAAPAMTGDPLVDIDALLKAQFDTPENPLTVAPITVQDGVAIAGWAQGGKGGRAFLRQDHMGWRVEVCAGAGLLQPEMLAGLGLTEADVATLLAAVTAAEAALGTETIALFDSFDGEMFFTE